jgi:rod shape determining protein RodA
MISHRTIKAIDKPFILVLAVLLGFGLLILTSASGAMTTHSFSYVIRQSVSILIGLGLLVFILNLDYTLSSRYSKIIYLVANLLLILVLIFGNVVKGTQGWLGIAGQSFQVAEFAKILLILSFADFLNKRQGMLNNFREMLPCFVYMGIPILLILKQPDLGTMLVFIAIMVGMMFVAGANPRTLVSIVVGVLLVVVLAVYLNQKFGMWLPMADYQIKRLTVFINPYNDGMGGRGPGWNTIQSLISVGSGGFFGKGLFNGTQAQLNFLPEHHTDFIFAVLGEELGFLGAGFLLILYSIFVLRAINIAYNAKDFYGTLVATGLISMWVFHIFENIGMSVGIMPITGIPLPFLSYGGSFMLANMVGVGILLNINIKGKKIVF